MQTILVPVDFSKTATNAAKYACAFADRYEYAIILFNAYEIPGSELNIPFADIHYGQREARKDADLRMNKLVRSVTRIFPSIKIKGEIRPGSPAENIEEYAIKNKIKLVMMGSTGADFITRTFIGSTVTHIISKVPCMVMVIPPHAKFNGIRKTGITTKLDPNDTIPMRQSISFTMTLNSKIILVHIAGPDMEEAFLNLQKLAERIRKRLNGKKVQLSILSATNIEAGINEFVKKEKPDLITMTGHMHSFPVNLWYNPVTKMTTHTHIPLLVIPSKRTGSFVITPKHKKVQTL